MFIVDKLRNKHIKLPITAATSVTAKTTLSSNYYMLRSNKVDTSSIQFHNGGLRCIQWTSVLCGHFYL